MVFGLPLRECLEAFALHRPDLGYVQGMSYIAAMLLLHIQQVYYISVSGKFNGEGSFIRILHVEWRVN